MTRAFQPLANVLMMLAKNLNGFLNFEITRWVTFRVLKKILFNNSRASKSFPSHDTLTNYIVNFYHVIGHVMFEINLVRFSTYTVISHLGTYVLQVVNSFLIKI